MAQTHLHRISLNLGKPTFYIVFRKSQEGGERRMGEERSPTLEADLPGQVRLRPGHHDISHKHLTMPWRLIRAASRHERASWASCPQASDRPFPRSSRFVAKATGRDRRDFVTDFAGWCGEE